MGIKVDWEFDDDPESITREAAQPPRSSPLLLLVIIVAVVVGGVSVALWQRGQHVDARLEETLRSAVYAETLALRIGDREAYLALQTDDPAWRTVQADVFDDYTTSGVIATGEILELQIEGAEAVVTLRESQPDGEVVWHYAHNGEAWEHVPPPASTTLVRQQTDHVDIVYYASDAPRAEALAASIDGWWEQTCALLPCRSSIPRMTVDFGTSTAEPPVIRLEADRSTWVGRATDADLIEERRVIVDYWVRTIVGPPTELDWVHEQFNAWVLNSIDSAEAPSLFMTSITEAYGPGVVNSLALIAGSREPTNDLIQGVFPRHATIVQGFDPTASYIESLLRAEAALRAAGEHDAADTLFFDEERSYLQFSVPEGAPNRAIPDTITVERLVEQSDILWAWVTYEDAESGLRQATAEPLRTVDGVWVRTAPLEIDYGQPAMGYTPGITVFTREGDFSLDDLQPAVERALQSPLRPENVNLNIYVTPNSLPLLLMLSNSNAAAASISVTLYSPATLFSDDPSQMASALVAEQIIANLVAEHAGIDVIAERDSDYWREEQYPRVGTFTYAEFMRPAIRAFTHAEMDRLGITRPDYYANLASTGEPPVSLLALWPSGSEKPFPGESAAEQLAAEALIEMLVELYGEQTMIPMLEQLYQSDNVYDWMQRSLDISTGDMTINGLEDLWRARVAEAWEELQ